MGKWGMAVESLNCPMCGAPADSDATRCDHCGAALATVACPSCFATMFKGAKFCSHCGAAMSRTEVDTSAHEPCPRCKVDMKAIVVGTSNLRECPKCEGLWVDAATLQQICDDRDKQTSVLGMEGPPLPGGSMGMETVRYLPCPVCGTMMNRINFAHCSNVIVDVCKPHGTWFDKDELRRVIEFIRAGGFEEARQREIRELEDDRMALKASQTGGSGASLNQPINFGYMDRHEGISLVSTLLKTFLK
jgi:Zn-finger nucleic acid-binding protein